MSHLSATPCKVLDFVKGPSINYVITSEGGGGCEMMMDDDGRGEGVRT